MWEDYQLQKALLQSFVLRWTLVKEIIREDHVGHPQAEKNHQRSSRVHGHGKADLVCAVCHTNRKASASLFCVVNQTITIVDNIEALVSNGGITQAFVSGLNLGEQHIDGLWCASKSSTHLFFV